MVQFIYQGQVEVPAHQVDAFLETAQEFQIQGIDKKTEGAEGGQDPEEEHVTEKAEYVGNAGHVKLQQKIESSSLGNIGDVKKKRCQLGPQDKCLYCDKMFTRKGWMKNHISTAHSAISAYAKDSTVHDTIDNIESQEKCPFCDQMFLKAQGSLKYHISALHSKVSDIIYQYIKETSEYKEEITSRDKVENFSNEEGKPTQENMKDAPLMETDGEEEFLTLSAERPDERFSINQDEKEYENYDPMIDDEDDPSENIDTGSGPLEEEDKSETNNTFNEIDSLIQQSKKLEEKGGKKIFNNVTEDGESLIQEDSINESENKYVCQYCKKSFSKLGGLNRHGEKFHPDEWEKIVINKNRVLENCLHCSKQFSTSAWMIKHVEIAHREKFGYSTESETEEKCTKDDQEKAEEEAVKKENEDQDIDAYMKEKYDEVREFDYDGEIMKKETVKDEEKEHNDQEITMQDNKFAEEGVRMDAKQKEVETKEDLKEQGEAKENKEYGMDMTSNKIFKNKFKDDGVNLEYEEKEFGDEGETMDDEERELEDESKTIEGLSDECESIEN